MAGARWSDRPCGDVRGNSLDGHLEWTARDCPAAGKRSNVPAGSVTTTLFSSRKVTLTCSPGRGSSPDVHRQVSLHHHVVGENFGKRHLGGRKRRRKQDRRSSKRQFNGSSREIEIAPEKFTWIERGFLRKEKVIRMSLLASANDVSRAVLALKPRHFACLWCLIGRETFRDAGFQRSGKVVRIARITALEAFSFEFVSPTPTVRPSAESGHLTCTPSKCSKTGITPTRIFMLSTRPRRDICIRSDRSWFWPPALSSPHPGAGGAAAGRAVRILRGS